MEIQGYWPKIDYICIFMCLLCVAFLSLAIAMYYMPFVCMYRCVFSCLSCTSCVQTLEVDTMGQALLGILHHWCGYILQYTKNK